jgi:hypothetical protein
LLTIFIILGKNSSYSENKANLVKKSIEDEFGSTKKKEVIFGRLANLKLDDYFLQIDKLIKSYGTTIISNDQDKLKILIPLEAIYYADEANFRNERMDDMMQLSGILKNWADNENIHIQVNMSETVYALDEKRLNFFRQNIKGERPLVGLKLSKVKNLEIIVERRI